MFTTLLLAIGEAAAPPTTPGAPKGDGVMPKIEPDMNAPGVSGFLTFINQLGAWVVVAAAVTFAISLLVFLLGPVLGMGRARQVGTIGMLCAVFAGGLLALFPGVSDGVGDIFA